MTLLCYQFSMTIFNMNLTYFAMLRNISILDSATEIIILVTALSFSCLPNMNKDETLLATL